MTGTRHALLDELGRAFGYRYEKGLALWKECEASWQSLQQPVLIVVAGLMNTGKSSLLNALLGKEEFQTADARTTTRCQDAKLGVARLVDTPGLDCRDEDDERAAKALDKADIILFVHGVRQGEYERAEVEFLRQRHATSGASSFAPLFIPIASKADGVSEEVLAVTVRALESQWLDIFGEPTPVRPTSSARYFKGLREERPRFMERSNIPSLRDELSMSVKRSKAQVDTQDVRQNLERVRVMLEHERALLTRRQRGRETRAREWDIRLSGKIDRAFRNLKRTERP